ncbi:Phosphoglycerate dehydrogenase, partial [Globisporangium splendens]
MWRFQRALSRGAQCARTSSSASRFSTSASKEFRILCVDVPQPIAEVSCVQELVQRGHVVDQVASADNRHLDSIIADYDALLVSPATQLSRELIKKGAQAKLQLVAVPADAIDSAHIDMMEATNQGVLMLQLEKKQIGDKFSVEAEIGLSLLIQLARNIPESIAATRSGASYQREQFSGTELSKKNLGIVGLGQAGKCVVEMARAMGLNVSGYDPNITQETAESMGVKRVALDELYANCDFLMFHAPLTARTRGMFNDAALEKCKDGVKIVSVAEYKGLEGLLDEQTLLKGLESGKISGVAIDTLQSADDGDVELSDTWKQLFEHAKVINKSHVDGKSSSDVASAKNYRIISENICDALAQRYYRGVANGVFMPLTLLPEMKPFLNLSEALGRFLYQLTISSDPKDQISKVSIATSGGIQVDITSPKAKSALQSAVLKGIFGSMAKHRSTTTTVAAPKVTLINSSMIAMTNGVDVRQGELAGNEVQHLNNSITVEVQTKNKKEKLLVMGSVFGEDPRIVRVNEYTDFPAFRPEGNLLIFNNEDKPGAIAGILNELKQSQINIANFGLSRQVSVKLALGILALDSVPSEETMASLKNLPTVQNLKFAQV